MPGAAVRRSSWDGHGVRAVGTTAGHGCAGDRRGAVRGRRTTRWPIVGCSRAARPSACRSSCWRCCSGCPPWPRPPARRRRRFSRGIDTWQRSSGRGPRISRATYRRGPPTTIRRGMRVLDALGRGELDISRRELRDVAVDDATLEHWQGSVLLKGVSIEKVADRLRHPERFPQPRDVLKLEVSQWSDAGHDLFLRLTRSMLITATYDTWYRVRHQAPRPDADRQHRGRHAHRGGLRSRHSRGETRTGRREPRLPLAHAVTLAVHGGSAGCGGHLRVDHAESPGAARARPGLTADRHACRTGVDDDRGASVAGRVEVTPNA